MVALGEDQTVEGWLIYGRALNEGRERLPKGDNRRFSEWVATTNLGFEVHCSDQQAAMSSAADEATFEATIEAVRT